MTRRQWPSAARVQGWGEEVVGEASCGQAVVVFENSPRRLDLVMQATVMTGGLWAIGSASRGCLAQSGIFKNKNKTFI